MFSIRTKNRRINFIILGTNVLTLNLYLFTYFILSVFISMLSLIKPFYSIHRFLGVKYFY